ncbi:MAG: S9 family peptidase [Herminiimonas sp.]|nr:S9 family peptidase [Herminiimonas sp.]
MIALLWCALAAGSTARAAEARAPIDSFFQNPAFSAAALSPDARFLAALVSADSGRVQLAVLDLTTLTPKIVAGFSDADISQFHWVNDKRLVYDVTDRETAQGDTLAGPGLYAVDRDGGNFRALVQRSTSRVQEHAVREALPWDTFFFSTIDGVDSDDIYVIRPQFSNLNQLSALNLLRLNTTTGRAVTVNRPGASRRWLLDQNGEPRLTTTREGSTDTVYYRDAGSDAWRKIAEFDMMAGFVPFMFGPDGTLYVTAKPHGRDKSALYVYDLKNNRMEPEPLVSLADYDFSGNLIASSKELLGAQYLTDAEATVWFIPRMKKMQEEIDTLLPGTINRLSVGRQAAGPHVLVQAFSDTQPSVFLLYDSGSGKLTPLGKAFPGIDARQMATKDMVRYQARDGLAIPAYLTLPRGPAKTDLPMVVLVHGGPYVRGGTWNWSGQAQFLASRGYAVLEPEFRGSTGFGWKHFQAGWKQWGLAMQNDVADGARWAIAQKIADPKRICIAGASYGGYATLMGLLNDPDLFKCGIDWVGVTDIDMLYSIGWSDASTEWQTYGMPRLVGDRVKDAGQLKTTSPLLQAARITQPLLLAYGGADRRVPIEHGTRFRDAVQRTNRDVEWVEYPEEGHGWALIKNRIDFWSRVEKFLDRNIGKP